MSQFPVVLSYGNHENTKHNPHGSLSSEASIELDSLCIIIEYNPVGWFPQTG